MLDAAFRRQGPAFRVWDPDCYFQVAACKTQNPVKGSRIIWVKDGSSAWASCKLHAAWCMWVVCTHLYVLSHYSTGCGVGVFPRSQLLCAKSVPREAGIQLKYRLQTEQLILQFRADIYITVASRWKMVPQRLQRPERSCLSYFI